MSRQTVEERLNHEKDIIRSDCEQTGDPLPVDMEQAARDALIGQLMEEIDRLEREIRRIEARCNCEPDWYC